MQVIEKGTGLEVARPGLWSSTAIPVVRVPVFAYVVRRTVSCPVGLASSPIDMVRQCGSTTEPSPDTQR